MKHFNFVPSVGSFNHFMVAVVLIVMYLASIIGVMAIFVPWKFDWEAIRLTASFITITLVFAHLNYRLGE